VSKVYNLAEDIIPSITYVNNAGEKVTEDLIVITDADSQAIY